MNGRRSAGALACAVAALLALTTAADASAAARSDRGGSVLTIGDSVMLGAQPCLEDRGYQVDAVGSRNVATVAQILGSMADLPDEVVVHSGTNGGADRRDLDAVMAAVGPSRQVVFLTTQLPDGTTRYTFEESTNEAIRRLPGRYPNVHVADWNALSNRKPGLTGGDGIHLTPDGCRAFARLVARTLRAIPDLPNAYYPMRAPLRSDGH